MTTQVYFRVLDEGFRERAPARTCSRGRGRLQKGDSNAFSSLGRNFVLSLREKIVVIKTSSWILGINCVLLFIQNISPILID